MPNVKETNAVQIALTALIPNQYDKVVLSSYDGNNNPGTIQYYNAGNVVATLTLVYSGSNLTSVERS